MALTIETGLGVAGADSYVSAADAIARALDLGIDFPDLADADVPLRRAAMFLESYRNRYQGNKYTVEQGLQWPRTPVYIDDIYQSPEELPQALIDAQISLASVEYASGNLFGTSVGGVGSRSVGDVSISSINNGSLDNSAYTGFADSLLAPLFNNPSLGGLEFKVCRA